MQLDGCQASTKAADEGTNALHTIVLTDTTIIRAPAVQKPTHLQKVLQGGQHAGGQAAGAPVVAGTGHGGVGGKAK